VSKQDQDDIHDYCSVYRNERTHGIKPHRFKGRGMFIQDQRTDGNIKREI
jgi:hypothetical protein